MELNENNKTSFVTPKIFEVLPQRGCFETVIDAVQTAIRSDYKHPKATDHVTHAAYIEHNRISIGGGRQRRVVCTHSTITHPHNGDVYVGNVLVCWVIDIAYHFIQIPSF